MKISNSRLNIIRGEDKVVILKMRDSNSSDPVDLNGITGISIELIKSNRAPLIRTMAPIPAKKAKATIVEGNDTIVISAENAGGLGNDIIIAFDGVLDVDDIILDWNTANPLNQIELTSGDGTVIVSEQDVQLYGGLNSYSAVSIEGDALLGKIKLNLTEQDTVLLRKGDNQLLKVTLDWGNPPSGVRKVAKFYKLDICDPTTY